MSLANIKKDKVGLEVIGLKETVEMLNTLPPLVQLDLMRRVNRQLANRIVKPRIKAAIPYSGELSNNVRTKNARKSKTGVIVGPHIGENPVNKQGNEVRGYPARLRFLMRGTKKRVTKKGYNRGEITGVNHIKPAVEAAVPEVVLKLQNEYGAMMERHLRNKTRAINRKIARKMKAKK